MSPNVYNPSKFTPQPPSTAYCDGILKGHEASEKLSAAAMED
eukprot:CAMPEP_0119474930 /NCGR_PEP_ID=MMETSP1344-20130328/5999_1 /TAXON_ID=236787 /ORGANISM="Florenciella parvula, Strain CCMP2471" /LENGTH=41 /DNA_ID= /DNA_START= /DNA_END= /DNA_ORIENTATION=